MSVICLDVSCQRHIKADDVIGLNVSSVMCHRPIDVSSRRASTQMCFDMTHQVFHLSSALMSRVKDTSRQMMSSALMSHLSCAIGLDVSSRLVSSRRVSNTHRALTHIVLWHTHDVCQSTARRVTHLSRLVSSRRRDETISRSLLIVATPRLTRRDEKCVKARRDEWHTFVVLWHTHLPWCVFEVCHHICLDVSLTKVFCQRHIKVFEVCQSTTRLLSKTHQGRWHSKPHDNHVRRWRWRAQHWWRALEYSQWLEMTSPTLHRLWRWRWRAQKSRWRALEYNQWLAMEMKSPKK